MTENEKYLYDHFLINIKSGFESLDDIIDGAIQMVEDEAWQKEIPEEWVKKTLTQAYDKHLAESKSWVANTDVERLIQVFDDLCRNKILAVHNIGYTSSEAIYDIQVLWQELEDQGIQPKGYCYYHGQDLERVITTGELMIGFSGVKEKNEKEAIAVGNKVKDALEKAGFTVKWNHSATGRIQIVDFNWQNLFESEEAIENKWGQDRIFDLMND